jgi:hypothetical protein
LPKRLTVSLKKKHAMQVSRVSVGKKKLVYVIIASKSLKYLWGRSHVAYIGTTKKGMARIAQSASARAEDVLGLHGVKSFHVRILTCAPRRNVKTWVKLERALLLTFRHKYGALPVCNSMGKKMKQTDEFKCFNRKRLEDCLEALA